MKPKEATQISDEKEIRLATHKEAAKITERFTQISIAMQMASNAFQRQVLTNLGTAALHEDKKFTANISSLTNGISSRMVSQAAVIYPSLQVRKYLTENTDHPQFVITLATTLVDTIIGVPLEVNSLLKTFKLLEIDIAKKDVIAASAKSFVPFFMRNGLAWCAINNNSQDGLASKVLYGAVAGAISTVPHNIGMRVVENSPNKTWEETFVAVVNEVRKQPNLFRGMAFRSSSIAASAILLAPQTTEFLVEKFSEIFSKEEPSKSPNNSVATKVKNLEERNK